jgi:ABC-2 type transport system permease protein
MRKYWAVLAVSFEDALAYRSQAVLWMLTDVVAAVIMPFVWLSSYNGRSAIGGFAPGQLAVYYLLMTLLSNFVVAHVQWEIGFAIRQGQLSKFLLYPLSYMSFMYISSGAWRIMRVFLFVPFGLLWLLIFREYVSLETFHGMNVGAPFWVALVLGNLVAFNLAWDLGMLAFYFVETQAVFIAYYILMAVFSGQLAPYNLLPGALKTLATFTPFRYSLSFPLEILNGRTTGDGIWHGMAMQAAWLVGLYLVGKLAWRYGSRKYTGVGL